jgi:hypothetical protein
MKKDARKRGKLTLVLVLLACLLLAGCGPATEADAEAQELSGGETEEAMDTKAIEVTMLGGSPTGTWYMVTTGIGECVNKSYPGSIVQITPGGGAANPPRIGNNEVEMGMTHNILAFAAKNGKDPFEETFSNVEAVAAFYSSAFQFVMDKSVGITTFDEIIENKMQVRISIDKPGSSAQVLFLRMLDEYGLGLEDLEGWGCKIYFKNFADSSKMLSDGLIDGFGINTLAPAPTIVESAISRDLVLLEINEEKVAALSEKFGYAAFTVPENTYKFNDHDVNTLAATSILAVSSDVPADKVYKVTKSIVENLDYMHDVHVALKPLTPQALTQNLGVPMHRGAEQYYREAGIIE